MGHMHKWQTMQFCSLPVSIHQSTLSPSLLNAAVVFFYIDMYSNSHTLWYIMCNFVPKAYNLWQWVVGKHKHQWKWLIACNILYSTGYLAYNKKTNVSLNRCYLPLALYCMYGCLVSFRIETSRFWNCSIHWRLLVSSIFLVRNFNSMVYSAVRSYPQTKTWTSSRH